MPSILILGPPLAFFRIAKMRGSARACSCHCAEDSLRLVTPDNSHILLDSWDLSHQSRKGVNKQPCIEHTRWRNMRTLNVPSDVLKVIVDLTVAFLCLLALPTSDSDGGGQAYPAVAGADNSSLSLWCLPVSDFPFFLS